MSKEKVELNPKKEADKIKRIHISESGVITTDGESFWWSESCHEWLPTVETLRKRSKTKEKSWPSSW